MHISHDKKKEFSESKTAWLITSARLLFKLQYPPPPASQPR